MLMRTLAALILLAPLLAFAEDKIIVTPARAGISLAVQQSKDKPDQFQVVITNGSPVVLSYNSESASAVDCFLKVSKDGKWTYENRNSWCPVGQIEASLPAKQSKTLSIDSPTVDPVTKTKRSLEKFRVHLLVREEGKPAVVSSPVYTLKNGSLQLAPK